MLTRRVRHVSGLHLVTRSGSRITYLVYNLSTGKLEQEALSPTDATAFIGRSDKFIQLHNGGEVSRGVITTFGPYFSWN